ncbi:MAG: DUF1549 domain-containing protein [Verrucomicrobiota bacterium]
MKFRKTGSVFLSLWLALPSLAFEEQRIWEAARQVDELVEKAQREAGVEPNAPAEEEVFLRRIYLDVAGRIPSFEETVAYQANEGPAPRSTLIRELLHSEAYVSQEFHYWADLLRLRYDGNDNAAPFYLDWVKSAIREHMPYDELVRRLVTAEGYAWDDPAVGFYTRDKGMPLDHMAFTVRVFLGTRMECAQCHNHPFDEITQKEFYHMAAFTYGTRGDMDPRQTLKLYDYVKRNRKAIQEDEVLTEREIRRTLRDLTLPMNAGAREVGRDLRLPHDYQYDDASPKEKIGPGTLFGEAEQGADLRETFADWMTSPENERFTRAIANRMWKKVMGRGLIEPEDNFTADTVASHPELMAYLESLMRQLDYDLRDFKAVLYNTRTYQREAMSEDIDLAKPFYFQGPLLKRMSAERMWDSVLTLAVPHLDERTLDLGQEKRSREREWQARRMLELGSFTIFKMAEEIARRSGQAQIELQSVRQEIVEATEKEEEKRLEALRKRAGELNRTYRKALSEVRESYLGKPPKPSALAEGKKGQGEEEENPWKDWYAGLVRASELVSPAPTDHFLQVFGQSNREVVNNASDKGSAIQALWLMNGNIYPIVTRGQSVLMKNLAQEKDLDGKRDVIFRSMLHRRPTPSEKEMFALQVAERGNKAVGDLIWMLLNSTEFAFVQ